MANNIVTVNVSTVAAPTPNKLQQTGAFISQGGTNTAPGTETLIKTMAQLTAILKAPLAITSLAWAGNVVTATTAAPHGLTNGDVLEMTIAGATPDGYNGTYAATITGASTFTYPLALNPGAETVPGTYVLAASDELQSMGKTFFDQGSQQAVTVMELGPGEPDDGIADLTTFLNANPNYYYAFLVPKAWADESDFFTLIASYEADDAKLYFFVTMDSNNYTTFTPLMKCVFGGVQAPLAPATEFTLASDFWNLLHVNPTPTNKSGPFAFKDLFGVTAYPIRGNQAFLDNLKDASVNYVGTGAEGGLTNTILFWGTTMDGRDMSYWYSVDWVQINADQNVANAIINGSNNPTNPLYYNQSGIDRLQSVLANTLSQGVANGLVNGTVALTAMTASDFTEALDNGDFTGQAVVNAVPMGSYSTLNPSHYAQGLYEGFTIVYVPQRGFKAIVINLVVTDFVAQ